MHVKIVEVLRGCVEERELSWGKAVARSINERKPVQNQRMIKPKNDIARVKQTIADCFRKQVDVTVNLGRNKVLKFCGELSGVYPALFTVSPNDKNFLGKTSYSYAEVLCGSVKIKPAKKAE